MFEFTLSGELVKKFAEIFLKKYFKASVEKFLHFQIWKQCSQILWVNPEYFFFLIEDHNITSMLPQLMVVHSWWCDEYHKSLQKIKINPFFITFIHFFSQKSYCCTALKCSWRTYSKLCFNPLRILIIISAKISSQIPLTISSVISPISFYFKYFAFFSESLTKVDRNYLIFSKFKRFIC